MKYLCIVLFSVLLYASVSGCNGVKHIIELKEPTDHTSGDDGGTVKWKLIFGDKNQKE